MPFRFRLEKVARYRQQLVDEQGRLVAEASRVVHDIAGRVAALEADIAGHLNDFGDTRSGVLNVQGMLARTLWVEHLDSQREAAEGELRSARAELAVRQDRLTELWRDREVLSKLRDKQHGEWRLEQARREKIELDEVGQIRADRARRSKVAT